MTLSISLTITLSISLSIFLTSPLHVSYELKQFYSAIIESVLCTSITVWFSSATKSDLRRLRRVVQTAEQIIGTTLPTLQELYLSRVSKRAGKITLDPSHPAHSLFELLPSGRRYRALSSRMTRHRNSFFPQAIHLMNT